jgi:hypothetical protein
MRNEVSRAFEEETVKRAESGNQEAALFALELAIREIEHSYEKSKIIDYFVSKVRLFLDNGVSLERALGIHSNSKDGGRPKKYDPTEVAAVDLLLRDHAGFKPEQAIEWIEINVGADRRFVQLRRKEYDARYNDFGAKKLMESRPVDDLLELARSLREKVGGVYRRHNLRKQ